MSLRQLALKHGTDKAGHHEYADVYERYFKPFKDKKFKLVEIGVGGYEFPDRGGESLRMWYEYFPNAMILGIDLYDKVGIANDRITIVKMSQTDEHIADLCRDAYIVIDDASHMNELTLKSFDLIFGALDSGCIYVIEDTHTSYWEEHGFDGCRDPTKGNTVMNYFKAMLDAINLHSETMQIASIHFYKQLIFIFKK